MEQAGAMMNNVLNKFATLWPEPGREAGREARLASRNNDDAQTRQPSPADIKSGDLSDSSGHDASGASHEASPAEEMKSCEVDNSPGYDASGFWRESDDEEGEIFYGLANPWGNTPTPPPNWSSKAAKGTVSYDELPIRFRFDPSRHAATLPPPGIESETSRSPPSKDLTTVSTRCDSHGAHHSGIAPQTQEQMRPARESRIDREHRLSLALEQEEISAARYKCPPSRWSFGPAYYEILANRRAIAAAEAAIAAAKSGTTTKPRRERKKEKPPKKYLLAGFGFEYVTEEELMKRKCNDLPPLPVPEFRKELDAAHEAFNERVRKAALKEEKELAGLQEEAERLRVQRMAEFDAIWKEADAQLSRLVDAITAALDASTGADIATLRKIFTGPRCPASRFGKKQPKLDELREQYNALEEVLDKLREAKSAGYTGSVRALGELISTASAAGLDSQQEVVQAREVYPGLEEREVARNAAEAAQCKRQGQEVAYDAAKIGQLKRHGRDAARDASELGKLKRRGRDAARHASEVVKVKRRGRDAARDASKLGKFKQQEAEATVVAQAREKRAATEMVGEGPAQCKRRRRDASGLLNSTQQRRAAIQNAATSSAQQEIAANRAYWGQWYPVASEGLHWPTTVVARPFV